MSTLVLTDLAAPLRVLRLLAVDYPELPAPTVDVSPTDPGTLRLAFHRTGSLARFEAWRAALGIDPGTVSLDAIGSDLLTLTADTSYAGATVRLTCYADTPPTAGAIGGA